MAIKSILVFFSIVFMSHAEVLTENVKQFELTTYVNGKTTFLPHKIDKISTFIPKDEKYTIRLKPKIIQYKSELMYIYDVSVNGNFLNAISFESLQLNGNVENISKVLLADNIYYNKDDSFPVKLNGNTVSLSSLYKNIDLTHLKYLVVIVKKDKTFNLESMTFVKKKYSLSSVNKIRSTWAWEPKNINIDVLIRHNIKQLYMQVKDGFETALKTLSSKEIKVYGLNGSASDVHEYSHLKEDIRALGKLRKVYPNIIGYQVDIEPYLLPDFKKNKSEILKKYLDVLDTLKTLAHKEGLLFSVAIPFWFDSLYYKNKNLGFMVADIADEIVLMSYRSDLRVVHKISKTLLAYAQLSDTKIRIGLELMRIEDEEHTIYQLTKKTSPCIQNNLFTKECRGLKKVSQYILKGSSISFYKQLYKLKNLDKNTSIHTPTFLGYVLHHYGELNKITINK